MDSIMREVGRYEILSEIGRGGMATVYLARQSELGRDVALKELSAFHARDPMIASRFVRESRVAASLSHPNIVMVHDFFQEGAIPYIAMEYLERGSLRSYVKRLALPQIAGVLEGVLAGLAQAEAAGIVHRDLKPENLLVSSDGGVKIADFGIAKAQRAIGGAALTATGSTVGTPTYMAPEQAMARDIGPWTDLYSVGVIAYEMLCGRVPFPDEEEPMAVLLHHINDPPPPLRSLDPRIDPRLAQWTERLLVKEPSQRTQSAHEAWDALEEILIDTLGARWRRNARLLSRVETVETPDPLTPAPFESTHSTPTPQPGQAAPAPTEAQAAATASGAEAAPTGAESAPSPTGAQPVSPEAGAPTAGAEAVPSPPTEAEAVSPEAGAAATGAEAEAASRESSSEFFTFHGDPPPAAPGDAPPAPPQGGAAAAPRAPATEPTQAPATRAPGPRATPAREAAAPPTEPRAVTVPPTPAAPPPERTPTTRPVEALREPAPAVADERVPGRRLPALGRGWWVAAIAAAGALLAAGGFLLAPSDSSGEDPPPLSASASSAALQLGLPSSFTRSAEPPRVAGLELSDAVALQSVDTPRTTIVAGISDGSGPTLLPGGAVRRAAAEVEPDAVALGRLEALRFDGLSLGDQTGRVYAAPTTAGVATLACLAPAGATLGADCDRIAATLVPLGAEPVALGPSEDYAEALNAALGDLATARDEGRAELGDADRPAAQADAATEIRDAYRDAARALSGAEPTAVDRPANAAITAALRRAGAAYGALADAARAGKGQDYDRAVNTITERERGVEQSLAALEALGYERGE